MIDVRELRGPVRPGHGFSGRRAPHRIRGERAHGHSGLAAQRAQQSGPGSVSGRPGRRRQLTSAAEVFDGSVHPGPVAPPCEGQSGLVQEDALHLAGAHPVPCGELLQGLGGGAQGLAGEGAYGRMGGQDDGEVLPGDASQHPSQRLPERLDLLRRGRRGAERGGHDLDDRGDHPERLDAASWLVSGVEEGAERHAAGLDPQGVRDARGEPEGLVAAEPPLLAVGGQPGGAAGHVDEVRFVVLVGVVAEEADGVLRDHGAEGCHRQACLPLCATRRVRHQRCRTRIGAAVPARLASPYQSGSNVRTCPVT